MPRMFDPDQLMDDRYWESVTPVLDVPQDLEQITGMARITVYRWLKQGLLPGHRLGTTWIVFAEEVRRKLEDPSSRPDFPTRYFDDFLHAHAGVTLSIADAAALLGMSPQTIYKWVDAGVLPARQLGVTWLLYPDELRDLLLRTSNQTTVTP